MKKFILLLALSFGFAFTTNAQARLVSVNGNVEITEKEKAVNEINQLDKVVVLSESLKSDFLSLLVMRADAVAEAKSYEDTVTIYDNVGKKLLSALTEEQVVLLKAQPDLYKRLTSFSRAK